MSVDLCQKNIYNGIKQKEISIRPKDTVQEMSNLWQLQLQRLYLSFLMNKNITLIPCTQVHKLKKIRKDHSKFA